MLKPLILALSASFTLLTAQALHAEVGSDYKVALLTENFAPFNMAAEGKNFAHEAQLSGIGVNVVQEMFKRAGIGYTMTLRFPWARIYKTAAETPDYGIFVMARTSEREALFKWVGPVGTDDWVMLAPSDSSISLNDLEQAKAYKVGAYQSDVLDEYLRDKGFELNSSLSDDVNLEKLQKGSIDLWATGEASGRYLAKQAGVTGLRTVLRFNQGQLYLGLNPSVPDEVVSKLQSALDQMRQDGTIERITNSYLQ